MNKILLLLGILVAGFWLPAKGFAEISYRVSFENDRITIDTVTGANGKKYSYIEMGDLYNSTSSNYAGYPCFPRAYELKFSVPYTAKDFRLEVKVEAEEEIRLPYPPLPGQLDSFAGYGDTSGDSEPELELEKLAIPDPSLDAYRGVGRGFEELVAPGDYREPPVAEIEAVTKRGGINRLVIVYVNPVRWTSDPTIIKVVRKLELNLTWTLDDSLLETDTIYPGHTRRGVENFNNPTKRNVVNLEDVEKNSPFVNSRMLRLLRSALPITEDIPYLIITPKNLAAEMERLAVYASSQSVNANSIIVTEACHTNAFDSSGSSWKTDPCLSEAFIRNPKSGVIGYLGSSRYGWSSTDTSSSKITSSQLYSANFFKNLFDPDNSNKKFGDLVRQTKLSLISSTSYYSTYRWLQYSLNPIGDPETEIFIDTPKKFNSMTIKNGSALEINSGVSGSSIKVMSKNDNGKSFYSAVENTQSISLQNFPLECNISITKSGFIPKVFSFSLIQNEVLSEDRSYSSDIIKVGRSVTSSQPIGNVVIRSKTITLNAPTVVLDKGTIIEKGAKVTIVNH